MEKLSDIKIAAEPTARETGNLSGVIAEIQFALQQLLENRTSHCIDLLAMPWSPGEEQKLEEFLGQGEIRVQLTAMGKSSFIESWYSGIWQVSHYNDSGELIGKLIEITYLPEMIFSQTEDIEHSLERLQANLPAGEADPG